MQTIVTKYLGPTNNKPSRIKAIASGSQSSATLIRSMAYDLKDDEQHASVAKSLCEKLGWTGEMVGGHTKDGMVWVFIKGSPRFTA